MNEAFLIISSLLQEAEEELDIFSIAFYKESLEELKLIEEACKPIIIHFEYDD